MSVCMCVCVCVCVCACVRACVRVLLLIDKEQTNMAAQCALRSSDSAQK